jgi:hypothetical protein
LRVVSGLSVGIEINFINAGLPRGAWLGVPCVRASVITQKRPLMIT